MQRRTLEQYIYQLDNIRKKYVFTTSVVPSQSLEPMSSAQIYIDVIETKKNVWFQLESVNRFLLEMH